MRTDLIKRYINCLPKAWLLVHKSEHGEHSGCSVIKFEVMGNKVAMLKGESAPPRENKLGTVEFAIDEMLTVKENFFHSKGFIEHGEKFFSGSGEPPQRSGECSGRNKNPCWNWNWLQRRQPSDYGCNGGKNHTSDHVGNKVLALADKELAHTKPNETYAVEPAV